MIILKKDITEVLKLLTSKINSLPNEYFDLENEKYYWEIPEDRIFDVFTGEPNLTIGDINSDWEELLRLLEISETPISYDLKRLGIILQSIRNQSKTKW